MQSTHVVKYNKTQGVNSVPILLGLAIHAETKIHISKPATARPAANIA